MSTMLPTACGVALLMSLVGCANDDWTFRPRDASAATDVRASTDRPVADVASPRDAPINPDAPRVDTGTIGPDVVVTADLGVVDAGFPEFDVVIADSGTTPTGLSLRAQGSATIADQGSAVGSLRLMETGFEIGDRACVGSLCLAGGLVP